MRRCGVCNLVKVSLRIDMVSLPFPFAALIVVSVLAANAGEARAADAQAIGTAGNPILVSGSPAPTYELLKKLVGKYVRIQGKIGLGTKSYQEVVVGENLSVRIPGQ